KQAGQVRAPARWISFRHSLETRLSPCRAGHRCGRPGLRPLDVGCPRPLGIGFGVVGHLGALGQRAIPVSDDSGLMHEQVLRAVIGCDEAEALLVAEPLDSSGRHCVTSKSVLATAEAGTTRNDERWHKFAGRSGPAVDNY